MTHFWIGQFIIAVAVLYVICWTRRIKSVRSAYLFLIAALKSLKYRTKARYTKFRPAYRFLIAALWLGGIVIYWRRGLPMDLEAYFQVGAITTTMYVLLVAFRMERLIRRTREEEELSLELAQNINSLADFAKIRIRSEGYQHISDRNDFLKMIEKFCDDIGAQDDESVDPVWRLIHHIENNSGFEEIKQETAVEKYLRALPDGQKDEAYRLATDPALAAVIWQMKNLHDVASHAQEAGIDELKIAELMDLVKNWTRYSFTNYNIMKLYHISQNADVTVHERLHEKLTDGTFTQYLDTENRDKCESMAYMLGQSILIRRQLEKFDKTDHGDTAKLRLDYIDTKTHLKQMREVECDYQAKTQGDENYECVETIQEIESDIDKFVNSKKQGANFGELIALAFLGYVAGAFLLFGVPVIEDTGAPIIVAVEVFAISLVAAIVFLFVNLLDLEHDRRTAIMGPSFDLRRLRKTATNRQDPMSHVPYNHRRIVFGTIFPEYGGIQRYNDVLNVLSILFGSTYSDEYKLKVMILGSKTNPDGRADLDDIAHLNGLLMKDEVSLKYVLYEFKKFWKAPQGDNTVKELQKKLQTELQKKSDATTPKESENVKKTIDNLHNSNVAEFFQIMNITDKNRDKKTGEINPPPPPSTTRKNVLILALPFIILAMDIFILIK